MKWIILFSVFLQVAKLGRIEKVAGEARLIRNAQSMAIVEGGEVFTGDIIITGKGGYVEILLEEGQKIGIGENTELKIDRIVLMEESILKKALLKINIFMGKVRGILRKGRKEWVNFTTPTAVVGVRGTEFLVISAEDGSSVVEVYEGEVSLLTEELSSVKEGERAVYDIMEEKYEVTPQETPFSVEEWLVRKREEIEKRKKEIEERHNRRLRRIIEKYEETLQKIESASEKGDEEEMEFGMSLFSMVHDGMETLDGFMRKKALKNLYEKRVREVRERWERRRAEVIKRFEERRKEIRERMEKKRKEIERRMREKRERMR